MPVFRGISKAREAPTPFTALGPSIPCHQLQAVTSHMELNLNLQEGTCTSLSNNQRNLGTD